MVEHRLGYDAVAQLEGVIPGIALDLRAEVSVAGGGWRHETERIGIARSCAAPGADPTVQLAP
jgi:hypothetical protein